MTDQPAPLPPQPASVVVERAWTERGWPSGVLTRAREMHISDSQLERMLFWQVPLERIEEEIRWADQLNNGTMRFRQLTVADNDEFCTLWANSPEEIGEWDVTAERGPRVLVAHTGNRHELVIV